MAESGTETLELPGLETDFVLRICPTKHGKTWKMSQSQHVPTASAINSPPEIPGG